MAAAIPYIIAAATAYSGYKSSQAAQQSVDLQKQALAEQRQLAQQGPQLTPEQQALRDTLTGNFQSMLAPDYQAVSQARQDNLYNTLAENLGNQSQSATQRLDASLGRRGLLGSSIATQGELGLQNQLTKALSNARQNIGEYAATQTQAQQNLARQGLANVNAKNLGLANSKWAALLNATQNTGNALSDIYNNQSKQYGDLASTLLAPYAKGYGSSATPAVTTAGSSNPYILNPYHHDTSIYS